MSSSQLPGGAVPDQDKIPIKIYGPWRKVYRSFEARRRSLEQIADDVACALASDVRRAGGLAGIDSTHSLITPAQPPLRVSPSLHRDGSTEVVGALALALNDHLALTSPSRAATLLAERLVKRWAWNRFDRMVIRLVGDDKYTAAELYALMRDVLSDEAIKNLVRRILRHPTGDGLRAPNRRERKLSHKELLSIDLGELA
jgi:hypothetical protein